MDAFFSNDAVAAAESTPIAACDAWTACIVDPSKMTREALCQVFQEIEPEVTFFPARSIKQIIEAEGAALPILWIIHVGAHSFSSGWVRRELVLAVNSGMQAAVFCDSSNCSDVTEAIRLGARGYVPTDFSPAAAICAIKLIRAGELFIPAWALQGYEPNSKMSCTNASSRGGGRQGKYDPQRLGVLSRRERAVLDLVCMGKPNKLIGRELGIAAATVKIHVGNIMKKLGVTNRTQICALMSGLEPHTIHGRSC